VVELTSPGLRRGDGLGAQPALGFVKPIVLEMERSAISPTKTERKQQQTTTPSVYTRLLLPRPLTPLLDHPQQWQQPAAGSQQEQQQQQQQQQQDQLRGGRLVAGTSR
jgi:hypothetical protein